MQTRGERQASTRAALLRSASRLICRHGMHGASIDAIAADAGYTKGAFYANFSSKQDLFLTMLEQKFALALSDLQAAMPGAGIPADEAHSAAERFLLYATSDPEWPRLYQEFAALAARDEHFRQQLAARVAELRERMAAVFAHWAASYGVKPTFAPEEVAAMTFFMADGFLMNRLIDPGLDESLYPKMIDVFMQGLLARVEATEP
ncbi:MAG TPA: TetR/AcrR family transcriptional regulator [Solirubrobacteraceae bacterium]|nr:TetR/AcrR family transcriptional regulator [Solirubrobacteraceae bacterium]